MQENLGLNQRVPTTWVLVADDKQAEIFSYSKSVHALPKGGANRHHYYDERSGHELTPVANGILMAESIDDYQLGHNRRGSSSSSNSPTHNTYEPHGDINTELKRRFAKAIIGKLRQSCTEKLFDRLVFVAPGKMIGELKEQMSSDMQNRIAVCLPKDLTHFHGQELVEHLSGILTENHINS